MTRALALVGATVVLWIAWSWARLEWQRREDPLWTR